MQSSKEVSERCIYMGPTLKNVVINETNKNVDECGNNLDSMQPKYCIAYSANCPYHA